MATRNANIKRSNFKKFEEGQDVKVERGKYKGLLGEVVGFDPETGKVEILDANGNTTFHANGTVNWNRNEFYDSEEFAVELDDTLDDLEFEEGDTIAVGETITVIPAKTDKPRPPKKERRPCQCNCGILASKGKMFQPGHDQRHKGNLIRAMQAGSEEAEAELRKRGWRTESEILQLKSKGNQAGVNLEEVAGLLG